MKETWYQTLDSMRGGLSDHSYNTWFKPLQFKEVSGDCVVVEVPNQFYRDRLRIEYGAKLKDEIRKISNNKLSDVEFVIAPSDPKKDSSSLLKDLTKTKKEIHRKSKSENLADGLNTKYTFDTFVVGSSNQFAHAAARAVADSPGSTYNPLFLYGGVGLGKTHLLCSIGNAVVQKNSGLRVVYRSAEKFMNELIHSIRYEKTQEFRNRYRETCDVLLIDDVQFLTGKERTQEEFFHTFNALYESNKQIVLTSDKYPKEIPGIDERLRSRFESGLLCDIQPPDIETRVAILKKKAENDQIFLSDDVALYLATTIKSNVRLLEGALVRLAAFASISSRKITLELTKEVLGSLAPVEKKLDIPHIQKRVAEFYHIHVSDLKSARRQKVVALPRQIAMYLSRKLTAASFPEIGHGFGGKDHTTVIHAVNKIEKLLQEETPLRNTLQTIEETLLREIS